MACGQKTFKLLWRYHQLLPGFLTNGHLPACRVSHACQLMIEWWWYDTGDCAQVSSHLPYRWGKLRETSSRRSLIKAVRPVIASNGVPSLQTRSVGSHSSQKGRRKERRKERGIVVYILTEVLLNILNYPNTHIRSLGTGDSKWPKLILKTPSISTCITSFSTYRILSTSLFWS